MKNILILWLLLIPCICKGQSPQSENTSSQMKSNSGRLPHVLTDNQADLIAGKLKLDAALKFAEHRLPERPEDWERYRIQLKEKIIRKAGVVINHNLPLNLRETGKIKMQGYSVKNIAFQTRPGIYATANLYVPDGAGPFPGVICMVGHWNKGKIDSTGPQAVGHCLAANGYVCLTVDPWGSGERTTTHGIFEDHGDENNLGSALMNIGEPLIGIEISDNIRGVDLLSSLTYVSSGKIGATGASGGGNQTMWLASLDERIKAAMLVVSAGTFEAHIMGSPCICEVMPDALDFTEEAGVLALVAPRALKMCSHKKDGIPAFLPAEMLRSYKNAKPIFRMYGAEENISYQLFDLPHGYMAEDRAALIDWFDLHLKGNGTTVRNTVVNQLPEEKLMVFPKGLRDSDITGTAEYCMEKGNILRTDFLNCRSFDLESKRKELADILGIGEKSVLQFVHTYPKIDGWGRFALETSDHKLIPVLLNTSAAKSNEFVILANPEGKDKIPANLIDSLITSGTGIAIVDLSGTGEASSSIPNSNYSWGRLRTVSRSELWFGKTLLGEWVKELNTVVNFLRSDMHANKISMDGSMEAGIAGLFLSAIENNIDNIILRTAPVSYLFDTRKGVDFFSSAINLTGFLNWGDVSLAAALSGKSVQFINPVSISGNAINEEKLSAVSAEFKKIRIRCNQRGNTIFNLKQVSPF